MLQSAIFVYLLLAATTAPPDVDSRVSNVTGSSPYHCDPLWQDCTQRSQGQNEPINHGQGQSAHSDNHDQSCCHVVFQNTFRLFSGVQLLTLTCSFRISFVLYFVRSLMLTPSSSLSLRLQNYKYIELFQIL